MLSRCVYCCSVIVTSLIRQAAIKLAHLRQAVDRGVDRWDLSVHARYTECL